MLSREEGGGQGEMWYVRHLLLELLLWIHFFFFFTYLTNMCHMATITRNHAGIWEMKNKEYKAPDSQKLTW